MSGTLSPRLRNRSATRQVNPELSIVTTASGRIAITVSAVSRTRRRICRARGNTSAMPMMASSRIGTSVRSPCSAMRSPPIPAKRMAPPVRSLSAAISAPPSASPEGSPAMTKISGAAPVSAMAGASARLDADDEELGLIGGSDDPGAVEDERRAGLDGDAAQTRPAAGHNGAHADGRQVGAAFLAGLGDLDEHAAGPLAPQTGTAGNQRIGALDRLDPEYDSLLDDDGLADIERAQRPRNGDAVDDIGPCLFVRNQLAERAARRETVPEDGIGADHLEAFALEFLGDRREQAVVAQRAIADAGKELRRAPIRPQRHDRRSLQADGKDDLVDACLV